MDDRELDRLEEELVDAYGGAPRQRRRPSRPKSSVKKTLNSFPLDTAYEPTYPSLDDPQDKALSTVFFMLIMGAIFFGAIGFITYGLIGYDGPDLLEGIKAAPTTAPVQKAPSTSWRETTTTWKPKTTTTWLRRQAITTVMSTEATIARPDKVPSSPYISKIVSARDSSSWEGKDTITFTVSIKNPGRSIEPPTTVVVECPPTVEYPGGFSAANYHALPILGEASIRVKGQYLVDSGRIFDSECEFTVRNQKTHINPIKQRITSYPL